MALTRVVLVVLCAVMLAACGGASQQLHSDAEKGASVAAEAALLARQAHAGRLTAPFVAARTDEVASDAQAAAVALEQDQGRDADRKALAADLRAIPDALRHLDSGELDRLAADAQRRQDRL